MTPLASAEAAESRLPRATRLTPRGGHIGMLVGPRAETDLWDPLAEWLLRPA